MNASEVPCAICESGPSRLYAVIDGHPYYACEACGSIHASPALLDAIDAGTASLGEYVEEYWQQERVGAEERAAGVSLCRAGEAILYCRRPVQRFLDVGAGPGFLLRNLQALLDPAGDIFHGVEKFPPAYAEKTRNYHEGGVEDLAGAKFDAGVCIEVVEHLTPRMFDGLAEGLARASEPGTFWLFNTGMPDYVRNEDPGYLDPVRRGHIVSYSLAGAARILGPHGFEVGQLPGKSFAFFAEYRPPSATDFEARIYGALEANAALLQRHGLLYHAAFESARSYLYYAGYLQRTEWALALQSEAEAAAAALPARQSGAEHEQDPADVHPAGLPGSDCVPEEPAASRQRLPADDPGSNRPG